MKVSKRNKGKPFIKRTQMANEANDIKKPSITIILQVSTEEQNLRWLHPFLPKYYNINNIITTKHHL